jgi:hypothetical protein
MSSTVGPVVAGFQTLPMTGLELEKLEAWLHGAGGTKLPPTSEWEITRWRFGKATLILYTNAQGGRRWTCNDYGVLSLVEKAMRDDTPPPAPVAPAETDQPHARRRRERLSSPSGAMDLITPEDTPITEAAVIAPSEPVGVTGYRPTNHKNRINLKKLLCERQEWLCFYCGTLMSLTASSTAALATFEHVVPKSAGGPDAASNLVIACLACNHAVGSMSVYEKMLFRDGMKSA